jgi:hypothetical protein
MAFVFEYTGVKILVIRGFLTFTQVLAAIEGGAMLTRPVQCPPLIYDQLMCGCWQHRPGDRMTAQQIRDWLRAFAAECLTQGQYVNIANVN